MNTKKKITEQIILTLTKERRIQLRELLDHYESNRELEGHLSDADRDRLDFIIELVGPEGSEVFLDVVTDLNTKIAHSHKLH
jgi:hypothetical protein